MKKILVSTLAVTALLFAACSSSPKPGRSGIVEETPEYVVVNHQAKDFGGKIPDWVTLYATKGINAVEALDEYKDQYVFIGSDTGRNLNALKQWTQNFSVAQEMARMVSTRVNAKFAGAAAGSPETEYGSYFETVVKNTANAAYSGARKEADYWIQRRYTADNREEYTYYVLVTIDQKELQRQINDVIDAARAENLTTEQETAVDRVKQAFYEGF